MSTPEFFDTPVPTVFEVFTKMKGLKSSKHSSVRDLYIFVSKIMKTGKAFPWFKQSAKHDKKLLKLVRNITKG